MHHEESAAVALVREFWQLMASNDFVLPTRLFAAEFVLEWPQSNERIRGGENFARLNAEYPAHGVWRFDIEEIVGDDSRVVSRVHVTDGEQAALAISFFEISGGQILRMTEFWPDPYAPPANRQHLTEPLHL